MPTEIRVTTALLVQGALAFALMDAVYVPLLIWRVRVETFRQLKWPLVFAAAFIWWGIWSWAIGNFWETVYSYLFPVWAQTWVPWIAFFAAGAVALGLFTLALRLPSNPVLTYCLLGAALGSLTHLWAVHIGVVSKPPMLQGASPVAAVVIAFFEYMFYWCTILLLAALYNGAKKRFKR